MSPIILNNLNLNEINNVHNKLQHYEDVLQENIDHPFLTRRRSKQYYYLFGILFIIVACLLVRYTCCKCCKISWLFDWLRRCRPKQCCPSICINIHNTITKSSVASHELQQLSHLQRKDSTSNSNRSLNIVDLSESPLLNTRPRTRSSTIAPLKV